MNLNGSLKIQSVSMNTLGRDIAVGDIHGCFALLEQELKKIQFSPEKDRLFSVGDLVDRGPESDQVLHWLDQPWFYAVCGNHDLMTWRRAVGQPVLEIDHLQHGGEWLDRCDAVQQARLAQRLYDLPLGIEVNTPRGTVGLIHADFPYDDWQAIHQDSFDQSDVYCCLWGRDRYRNKYREAIRNIRAVVHGHCTVPQLLQLANVYYIDTGGWREGGHFTLFDLEKLQPISASSI